MQNTKIFKNPKFLILMFFLIIIVFLSYYFITTESKGIEYSDCGTIKWQYEHNEIYETSEDINLNKNKLTYYQKFVSPWFGQNKIYDRKIIYTDENGIKESVELNEFVFHTNRNRNYTYLNIYSYEIEHNEYLKIMDISSDFQTEVNINSDQEIENKELSYIGKLIIKYNTTLWAPAEICTDY